LADLTAIRMIKDDVTSNSPLINHTDAPSNCLAIMTITTKDAFGKTYVILRMWIPNQKTWMFRYVILDLIPAMIGVTYACRVRAIVSDGDPQLIKVIDLAIAQKYRNAVRIPCAWHIIDRSLLKARREFHVKWNVSVHWLEWFLQFLAKWLNTFMKPRAGINLEEEYKVSKCILLAFINSQALENFFTPSAIDSLNSYLQEKVFCYESSYCESKEASNFKFHSSVTRQS
jgi:hypothetical protein